jgi:peptide/nickel transport system ATP-binding protein
MKSILEIKNLNVTLKNEINTYNILEDINFDIYENEIFGIIGESGSGKSMLANSIIGLLPEPEITISSGNIYFRDIDLSKLDKSKMVKYRNNKIAIITQEPYSAFDPILKIKEQIFEVFLLNGKYDKISLREKTVELLNKVYISNPEDVLERYPHELSTGMLQRILIAIATINEPDLLIADEPTSSLDLMTQKKIIELILELKSRNIIKSVMFISHNISLIGYICDRLLVLYAGKVQEIGSAKEISQRPFHPYSEGIINAVPNPYDVQKKVLNPIPGNSPDIFNIPKGCKFNPRCKYMFDKCKTEEPDLTEAENRFVRCHLKFYENGRK